MMKNFKLSKAGLLILAAGAFIVLLGVLGFARYGQIAEEEELSNKVSLSVMRIDNLDVTPYQSQLAQLQAKLYSSQMSVEEAKFMLKQSVVSVDVVEKCYEIGVDNEIIVEIIGTTQIQTKDYEGIPCSLTTVNAKATGSLIRIISYVAGLNDSFPTGVIQSVQMKIADGVTDAYTEANIVMIVYSYEGD
jgi:hypothetical protein